VSLERAVELEPANHEYLRDLFDFYLDAPEWLGSGLEKAALLVERIEPDDRAAQAFLRAQIDEAKQDYNGLYGRLRQGLVIPAGQVSRVTR
jgi:hypothetical protein